MRNNNNNQINIPQARGAGSVEGQMVKNICPERTKKHAREIRIAIGHLQIAEYIAAIAV